MFVIHLTPLNFDVQSVTSYGYRCFSVAVAELWNILPKTSELVRGLNF